jgi:hypothetical protein
VLGKAKRDGPYYRKRAREIRAEAERAIALGVKNQLREIADRYERLAIEADNVVRPTSNQDTPQAIALRSKSKPRG